MHMNALKHHARLSNYMAVDIARASNDRRQ